MEVEVVDNKRTMQKEIKIDYRSIQEPNFANMIYESVVQKVAKQIAKEFLAKNSAKIIAGLEPEVISNLVTIEIAKKAQLDFEKYMRERNDKTY